MIGDILGMVPGPAWAIIIGLLIIGLWRLIAPHVSDEEPQDGPVSINLTE